MKVNYFIIYIYIYIYIKTARVSQLAKTSDTQAVGIDIKKVDKQLTHAMHVKIYT